MITFMRAVQRAYRLDLIWSVSRPCWSHKDGAVQIEEPIYNAFNPDKKFYRGFDPSTKTRYRLPLPEKEF